MYNICSSVHVGMWINFDSAVGLELVNYLASYDLIEVVFLALLQIQAYS